MPIENRPAGICTIGEMEVVDCSTGFAAALSGTGADCRTDCPQENSKRETKRGADNFPVGNTFYFLTGFSLDPFAASTVARVGVPLQQAIPPFVHWAVPVLELVFAATGFACCATAALPHQLRNKRKAEQAKRLI